MTDAIWTSNAVDVDGIYYTRSAKGRVRAEPMYKDEVPSVLIAEERSTHPIPSAEELHAMREVCEKARDFVEQQGALRETLEAFCVNQAAFGFRSHTVELDALGQALDALDAATRKEHE